MLAVSLLLYILWKQYSKKDEVAYVKEGAAPLKEWSILWVIYSRYINIINRKDKQVACSSTET